MSGLRSRSIPAPGPGPVGRAERGRTAAPQRDRVRRRASRSSSANTRGRIASTSRSRAGSRSSSTRGCRARGRGTSPCCSTTRPTTSSRSAGPGCSARQIVGLNHTRRGEHLLRDIEHTHCGLVITEPRHEALLAPIAGELPPVLVSTRFADADDPAATLGAPLEDALAAVPADDLGVEPDIDAIWALIFTSGTSSAPKAVICSQRRLLVTGNRMRMIMDLARRRRRLRLHAALPLERGPSGLGAVTGHAVRHRARAPVLGVGLVARHPPLRVDLLQLHRQAARVPPRATRTTRRRRQHAARRVRQRGFARGRRDVRGAGTDSKSSTRTARRRVGSR